MMSELKPSLKPALQKSTSLGDSLKKELSTTFKSPREQRLGPEPSYTRLKAAGARVPHPASDGEGPMQQRPVSM